MEEPAGRSRRAVRPASKAAGALAQLAELRRTGVKQVNAYEFKEEEAVFDVVAEDEYADIVARRRGDGGALKRLLTEGARHIVKRCWHKNACVSRIVKRFNRRRCAARR